MHLSEFIAVNSGPITKLHIDFAFNGDLPLPTTLLGTNGRGKTSILSMVTDAIFEGAAQHFQDVLPSSGMGRSWFRLVGNKTIRSGSAGGFSVLRFSDDSTDLFYSEKGGTYSADVARNEIPPTLHLGVNWQEDAKAHKSFTLPDERAEKIFREGVYAYFPSSRSEHPYWLNRNSIQIDTFDGNLRLSEQLSKPIFVENGLQEFAQWLLTVLVETRRDERFDRLDDGRIVALALQPDTYNDGAPLWQAANQLLRKILRSDTARFIWFGRRSSQKLGIDFGDGQQVPGLDGLSAGQASLLLIFGTLLRYADQSSAFTGLDQVVGICVADEIDSHLHIALQSKVLPELIAMFPRVQFIMSSHSPLFALAMERRFGAGGMRLFDLDTATYITAGSFSEFDVALKAIAETEQFENEVLARVQASGKPLVMLEGETDPIYLVRAAKALGKSDILERVELQWVGEKRDGSATNTGKSALNHAYNTLRSNPNLTNRPTLLLYDCDTQKPAEDIGNLHVRAIPRNANSKIALDGIENLLPDSVFLDEMYDEDQKSEAYGGVTKWKRLNKMRLCQAVCDSQTDVEIFSGFEVVFQILEGLFPPS